MTDESTTMILPDGSNPEGVDPSPPLAWKGKDDLTDITVHGPYFSTGTTKLRCYLIYANLEHIHLQHMKDKPQGMKPDTDYKKVPVIDVAGRQVNDTGIILKFLAPAMGLEFNEEWENRIVLELDTAFKIHTSRSDWAKLAVATIKAPWFLSWPLGYYLQNLEKGQGHNNIANSGLGHKEGDEVEIAKLFKKEMGDSKFFHGDKPGTVDISFFGMLAGFLFCKADISTKMVEEAKLEAWVAAMEEVIPLKKIFAGV
jgi:glutathione S-transferase